jgi:osmotically-inducible protein OsmY
MNDVELQHAVAEELEWAPHVDASHVTVTVNDGIVQLTGFVSSLAQKKAAERAVWHIRGVRGLVPEIEVRIPEAQSQADDEIAHRAKSVLQWDTQIPSDRIQIEVENGVIRLIGSVDSRFQRIEAEERVHRLAGVKEVDNRLVIHRSDAPVDIKNRVERAFRRHAQLHAADITIQVDGHRVTLTGHVPSVNDIYTAETAAWSAAAVDEVDNRLLVQP